MRNKSWIELVAIDENSIIQLTATNKSSAIDILFIKNLKTIKKADSYDCQVDDVGIIDANSTRSLKV